MLKTAKAAKSALYHDKVDLGSVRVDQSFGSFAARMIVHFPEISTSVKLVQFVLLKLSNTMAFHRTADSPTTTQVDALCHGKTWRQGEIHYEGEATDYSCIRLVPSRPAPARRLSIYQGCGQQAEALPDVWAAASAMQSRFDGDTRCQYQRL